MRLSVLKVEGRAVEYNLQDGMETRVSELKRLVQDEHVPAKAFRLVYEGRTLREDKSLKACGVREGGTVEMSMRLRGGSFSLPSFWFPCLKKGKRRTFSERAPRYKTVHPGLNLKGRCTNKACVACGKHVWCRFGFSQSPKQNTGNEFDIGVLIHQMTCPSCKSALPYDSVVACGFYKCRYSYEGRREGNASMIQGGRVVDFKNGYERHDGAAKMKKWTSLKIVVNPL